MHGFVEYFHTRLGLPRLILLGVALLLVVGGTAFLWEFVIEDAFTTEVLGEPEGIESTWRKWEDVFEGLLFAAGAAILLGYLLWKSLTERDRVERLVAERTAELSDVNLRLRDEMAKTNQVEKTLREHRDQLQLITDHLPVVIIYIDQGLRLRFANWAAEIWYRTSVSEMVGHPVDKTFGEAELRTLQPKLEAALSGQSVVFDATVTYPDGKRRAVEIALVPDAVDGGEVRGCFGLIQDVTQRNETEAQLRQAQKMEAVGQLTGGVAHDFNNILSIIRGNMDLLPDLPDSEDDAAGSILRATKRGAELTQRLLAFSRQQPLRPQPVDMGRLVDSISGLLARTLGRDIVVETVIGQDLWAVLADPGQLENALLNLAINARDAMPQGGNLTIECLNARVDEADAAQFSEASAGDYGVLSVADNGMGMPPEVLEHALEPFFTTKGVGEGSGLGLSMIYGFAKQSSGHIAIRSELGEGTTVKLYLPRAPDPITDGEPAAS